MNPLLRIRTWAVAAVVASALFNLHAAEDTSTSSDEKQYLPWEKGSLRVGGFITTFDSSVSLGVNNGGVSVNTEDILGLDSTLTVFRVDATYRPGESRRNQLDFTYSRYNRSGSASLIKDIDIDGNTYPIGTLVDSYLDFSIIRGTYSYALVQNHRMRIALGLGIYAVPLSYGVTLQPVNLPTTVVEGGDTTLPLPALALRAEFQLVPKLFLGASIDGMYLEIDNFQGSLVDVNVALEYRPWKHFGFGVGYNFMNVSIESETSGSNYPGADFVGTVDVRYTGLLLYAKWSF